MFPQKYNLLRKLAAITHGDVNIKGGNYFQDEIFKVVYDSGKHSEVFKNHPLPLYDPKKQRKHHYVDILTIDSDGVRAYNSKGKSFNNTKSVDSELSEYQWYIAALEKDYPGKNVSYSILKDEYDLKDSKMSAYHYLNNNGVKVYNTEEFLSQYNIDFYELEKRRQKRCVDECEKTLLNEGFDLEKLYESLGLSIE